MTRSEVLKFSAGGFRDFTRIAASDPTMWRDVFLANKDAVLEMLGRFNEDLAKLTRAIRRGDGDALFDLFAERRAIRRGMSALNLDAPAPDFQRPDPEPRSSRCRGPMPDRTRAERPPRQPLALTVSASFTVCAARRPRTAWRSRHG